MRIAVVGAGFCGAALTYFLSKNHEVTLFDKGGGASRVSSGLMHPYPGRHCRLSDRAFEGIAATNELIRISEEALGENVALSSGILRLIMHDVPPPENTEVWSLEKVQEKFPGMKYSGFFIPEGVTVYPEKYLQGLLLASKVLVTDKTITRFSELDEFDAVILTAGAGIAQLFPDLPLKFMRGQILTVKAHYPLAMSLLGKGYIAAAPNPNHWHIGSTYERNSDREEIDLDVAKEYILPKVASYYDQKEPFEILACRSGVRVANQHDYRPTVTQLAKKTWVMTGMGSRGLLYHALLAKELAATFA